MKNNRFALRDFLRRHIADAPHIRIDAAIAFVNARGFAGDTRPTDVQSHELIWADDTVLYVGVSRAVFGLSVIGPKQLGEHLGLAE